MITAENIDQLRALKGAPLSILVAMMLAHSPIGVDHLVVATGWGKDKVREGLSVLHSKGLATPLMRYNGWELTARAQQLSLFEGDKIALADPSSSAAPHRSSQPTYLSSSSSSPEGEKIALADPEIIQALHHAGIGEPVAHQLATLPHITLEYIQAHVLKAKEDHIPPGLLIHRMRSGDQQPALNANGHLEGCICEECHRISFKNSMELFNVESI